MVGIGFTISTVVVVESLEPQEPQTGTILFEQLRSLLLDREEAITVTLVTCESAAEFSKLIVELEIAAGEEGERPLLHVECHGDLEGGLEFANGSRLGWDDLSAALTRLNLASGFNLLASFSACYGAHFLGQMAPAKPSPCYCLLAPSQAIRPDEVMAGTRTFFRALFESGDAGQAAAALVRSTLVEGIWFAQTAEMWFEHVVVEYARRHGEPIAFEKWARSIQRRAVESGLPMSYGRARKGLVSQHNDFERKYFDRYFMTADLPANSTRFAPVLKRVRRAICKLRADRKICI